MSFLKYQRQNVEAQQHVFFNRADRDGAPFRGAEIPFLREAEWEALTQRVCDTKWGLFCTADPECRQPPGDPNGRTYAEVLDGITASWFELLSPRQYRWSKDADGNPVMYVYVEWAEPYRELAAQSVSRT